MENILKLAYLIFVLIVTLIAQSYLPAHWAEFQFQFPILVGIPSWTGPVLMSVMLLVICWVLAGADLFESYVQRRRASK
jgi:hypothetical protein